MTRLRRAAVALATLSPVGVVLPVALAPTAAFAQDNAAQARTRRDTAYAALEAKDYDRAIAEYTASLALEPGNDTALLNRGFCYFKKGDYSKALEDYTAALEVLPESEKIDRARALTNRADTYRFQENWEKAFVDAGTAISVDPDFAFGWRVRAQIRYDVGDYEGAVADAAEGKKRKADLPDLTLTRADADANKGKRPDAYKAIFQAASALGAAMHTPEALAGWDTVLRLDPDVPGAYFNRAIQRNRSGDQDGAIADYTACVDKCGSDADFQELKSSGHNNRGNLYRQRGDLDKALVDADAGIAANDKNAFPWRLRALIRYAKGDYDGAVADYAEAKKRKPDIAALTLTREGAAANAAGKTPDDPKAVLAAARAAVENARTATGLLENIQAVRAATTKVEQLLALDPKSAEGWTLRGEVEELKGGGMRVGGDPKAEPFYDRAIAADPAYGPAYLRRGLLRLSLLFVADSVAAGGVSDLDRALSLGVSDARAFAARGKWRDGKSDYAGAIDDFTRALALQPGDEDLLSQRAAVYERKADWPHAIADRTSLIERKATGSAYTRRGDDYADSRDFVHALADFDRAIALEPDDADHRLGRARVYRLQGDRTKAVAEYAAARAMDDSIPAVAADLSNADAADKARHNLARALKKVVDSGAKVLQAQNELNKAERAKKKSEERLRRLIAGDKRTPAQIIEQVDGYVADGTADAQDYLERARAYGSQEKLPQVIADCTRSIALKPTAEAYNLRGICYETNKEYDRAFADYDRAVALDPSGGAYVRNRGDMHYEKERFDAAWSDYDKAVALEGKNPLNYFKRGNASFQRKKYDDAIADYDRALEIKPDFEDARRNREIARKRKTS